jgi:hypothetical protein
VTAPSDVSPHRRRRLGVVAGTKSGAPSLQRCRSGSPTAGSSIVSNIHSSSMTGASKAELSSRSHRSSYRAKSLSPRRALSTPALRDPGFAVGSVSQLIWAIQVAAATWSRGTTHVLGDEALVRGGPDPRHDGRSESPEAVGFRGCRPGRSSCNASDCGNRSECVPSLVGKRSAVAIATRTGPLCWFTR